MNTTKPLFYFIIIPVFINLVCIGLYFSGIEFAQQIIAPTIAWLPNDSWREFGLLEQLQNFYLLIMLAILLIAVINRTRLIEKLFFGLITAVILFIFLEEIDYGLHFYEFFNEEYSGIKVRNWHNQETDNKQNVSSLKKVADIIMVIWFVILPLFKNKINNGLIKSMIPSCWFISAFIITIIMTKSAHFLDHNDYSIIDGVPGNLSGNISEFKEANNYYLFLLYVIQLVKIKSFTTSESD